MSLQVSSIPRKGNRLDDKKTKTRKRKREGEGEGAETNAIVVKAVQPGALEVCAVGEKTNKRNTDEGMRNERTSADIHGSA